MSPSNARRLRVETLEDRRMLTTVVVDTNLDVVDSDDGLTSLREAIIRANESVPFNLAHADSSVFANKYDGAQIFNGGSSRWETGGGAEHDDLQLNGTIVTLTPDDTNGWLQHDDGLTPWESAIVGVSWTVEVRAKVAAVGGNGGFTIFADRNGQRNIMTVRENSVNEDGGNLLASGDNTSEFHNFRMTYDSVADVYHFFRDGRRITPSLGIAQLGTTTETRLVIGDCCTTSGGGILGGPGASVEYEYIRYDIGSAYAPEDVDTITFDPAVFTGGASSLIRLSGTELEITDTLTIDGTTGTDVTITADSNADDVLVPGTFITDVTASGTDLLDDNSRVLNISGVTGNQTLKGLTLTGGYAAGSGVAGGGVLFNTSGDLTIISSTVSGNRSRVFGGGIASFSGAVTLISSTVSGNRSGNDGGGIFSGPDGDLTISGSTISGNVSGGNGGGILNVGTATVSQSTISGNIANSNSGGGINNVDTLTVTSSTIAGNQSLGFGGGIDTAFGVSLTLVNTILAGNTTLGGSDLNLGGAITNGNFNLIDVDPLLGPLADNGGPTQTHALLPGSPAIDAGDPSVLPDANEFDQRGAPFVRVAQGLVSGIFFPRIDIGAYEAQGPPQADFDFNLTVNGNDFLVWQRGFGMTSGATANEGDADNDGDVDASDLAAWQVSYGDAIVVPPLVAAQAGSGPLAAGSEELIDAAMAWEQLPAEEEELAAPLVDAKPQAVWDDADVAVELSASIDSGEAVEEATAEATDESESQPWLADELLESVFS